MRFTTNQNGQLLVDHGLGWNPASNQAPAQAQAYEPQYGVGALGQSQSGGYIGPVVGTLALLYVIGTLFSK